MTFAYFQPRTLKDKEIEAQLQTLFSSEDEETDDDLDVNFFDILINRLDEIQDVTTDERY